MILYNISNRHVKYHSWNTVIGMEEFILRIKRYGGNIYINRVGINYNNHNNNNSIIIKIKTHTLYIYTHHPIHLYIYT